MLFLLQHLSNISSPGGKLSRPQAFCLFNILRWLSTLILDTCLNLNILSVLMSTFFTFLQRMLLSGKRCAFNFLIMDEKYDVKPFAISKLSEVNSPFTLKTFVCIAMVSFRGENSFYSVPEFLW